jgi:RNA polymerase sigma-70 factor (ECF subfamily)
LGVLKFLKWKIRLLSLDVIRASSTRREIPVPEHVEYASDDQELIADLERAEDSAVIQMALAKLNPRQREALVASVYEEKSSEEVAEQLGLSPNATRQLLFRARSAFKKALVGEAEIQGKSLGQVLTIAAKKAAYDAKENATKVGAFIVLAAVGLGIVPSLVPSGETVVAEAPAVEQQAQQEQSPVPAPTDEPSVEPEQNTASESRNRAGGRAGTVLSF